MVHGSSGFTRPTFRGLTHFWREFTYLLSRRAELRTAFRSGLISPAFRERLMLAVTGVHRCPYCSWQHTRLALEKGLSAEEIKSYLGGDFEQAPEEEAPALIYAQYWAEQDAQPDPAVTQRLVQTYGQEKGQAIELMLHIILVGNLTGNTWDYWLYRLSRGRWGSRKD